jgi:hypothetical protein
MKKGKRSAGWQDEEQSLSPKIEFDLADEDTDGIIDLDEILEVDDDSLLDDEEQLDLDVEILDADADLDVDELNAGLSEGDEELLESDFLQDLSATDRETVSPDLEATAFLDEAEGDDDGVDFDSLLRMEMDDDEAARIAEEMVGDDMVAEPPPVVPAIGEELESAPASLELFVSQIEERLIDAVRQVVEEKLPEIVRSLLEEQIEKLKRELH